MGFTDGWSTVIEPVEYGTGRFVEFSFPIPRLFGHFVPGVEVLDDGQITVGDVVRWLEPA